MNQNKSASKKSKNESKNDENKENSSNKPSVENKVKNQPGNKKSTNNKLQVQNTENKQKKDDAATTTNRRLKDSNTILTESSKWSSFIGEQKQQSKAEENKTSVKKKEKAPKKKLELETSSSNTNDVNSDAVSKRAKTNETTDGLLRLPINDTPIKSDPIVNFPSIGHSLPMTPLPVHFYKYDEDRNLFSFELIENVRTFYFLCVLRIDLLLKMFFV